MKKEFVKKVQNIDTNVDKKRMLRKDSDTLKVRDNVFDEPTLKTLYTLSNKGIVAALGGSISTGKEANIFLAVGEDESDIAIKIYRISSSTFNSMEKYILGDPRFRNIRHSKRDIIFAWTKKEERNLIRAKEAGVRAPIPIITERNMLVMEFLGENGQPYPQLRDFTLNKEQAQKVFDIVSGYIEKLYVKANLVHGDLSEYNIIMDPNSIEPIFIDMGQSVTLEHPRAREFIIRDIENVVRYFHRFGIEADADQMLSDIREKKRIKNSKS